MWTAGGTMSRGRLIETIATNSDWYVCCNTCVTWRLPRDHQRASAGNQSAAGAEQHD